MERAEQHVEIFKLKRLIKKMENLRGNGTALLTLIIQSGKQLSDISNMLRGEYSQAQNIQDKNMKDSVLDALTKMLNRVQSYGPKAPKNGIVILAGQALEEKIIEFVPWKKMEHFVFKSDDVFHMDKLRDLANFDEPVYGFIVMDGHSALFAQI
jgi:peptide chain release factor subunit 1